MNCGLTEAGNDQDYASSSEEEYAVEVSGFGKDGEEFANTHMNEMKQSQKEEPISCQSVPDEDHEKHKEELTKRMERSL